MPRDVSIVLGPGPSRLQPIAYAQLQDLAARRSDVKLCFTNANPKAKRDTVLIDPTGRVPGELLFIDGRLQIRDPEHATLEWMIELAADLGGRVRDNTLKTYRSAGETYRHPEDDAARLQLAHAIRKARRLDKSPSRSKLWSNIWWLAVASTLAVALLTLLHRG
jgi:hypothetical protein